MSSDTTNKGSFAHHFSREKERLRRMQMTNMRQVLMTPVNAIGEYARLLLDETTKRSLGNASSDLGRIIALSDDLKLMTDRLLSPDGGQLLDLDQSIEDSERRIRHDLRNPIGAIKGFTEMLIEDVEAFGITDLLPDLERLLAETNRLHDQIDQIVDFSGGGEGQQSVLDLMTEVAGAATLARKFEDVSRYGGGDDVVGRILIVDDIESNRTLLARRLSRAGHETDTAGGGHEALEKLATKPYDIVLLDLMMPEMNGFEVLERITDEPELAGISVIMVSALEEQDGAIRCIGAGAIDYLSKPVNPVLLRARIQTCLHRKRLQDREKLIMNELSTEKERSERLLQNILPHSVIRRLESGETAIADAFDDVTVLFSDFVGFTRLSARHEPRIIVENLGKIFSAFDDLAMSLGVEKVKTIGDAYMVAGGLPGSRANHAEAVAEMAVGMFDILKRMNDSLVEPFSMRIGMNSGPVVAGIIGKRKFVYDIWGDTVNMAARYESYSEPNRIHMSAETASRLKARYDVESRGVLDIRGKGKVETFFLNPSVD